MSKQYLIRLDDACPTHNSERWARVETILDRYKIRPLVGIVPDNTDPKLICKEPDKEFWDKARAWQRKGWTIALHGLNHAYHKCQGGLNPLWDDSEFVGHDYDTQLRMLQKGVGILRNEGLRVEYFFAPSHTFDLNTVRALREIGINRISDTIAMKPYTAFDAVFIPQIGGRCRRMPLHGIYTFCLHPNTMTEDAFARLETFLADNADSFTSFDRLSLYRPKGLSPADRLFRLIYFLRRRLKSPKK